MSLDSMLLVRRWPERRPVVLGAALLGFAAVFAAARATDEPSAALGLLNILPVMLVALELGLAGGLAAAAVAVILLVVADAGGEQQLDALGIATHALAFTAGGVIAGWFSERMSRAHARAKSLLDSGLALGDVGGVDAVPGVIAAAVLRLSRGGGAVVELAGTAAARAGRTEGERTAIDIVARGVCLGRIEVVHDSSVGPEERAALELLAMQAGLAADNQRLLACEREARAVEAELVRVRDELLEQRSGLSRLLDAQEDERRRVAEHLHEQLAQVLAAVLLGLRTLGRGDDASVDDLHRQVVGVLDEVRNVAASLRPSSLEQLGLVPALEALARVLHARAGYELSVTSDGEQRVDEPLRTATYRIVEQLVVAAPAGSAASVRVTAARDGVGVALTLPLDQPPDSVRAARARVAALDGTLNTTPSIDDLTRIRIRLPLQDALAARERSTGSAARTTVPDVPDSISS